MALRSAKRQRRQANPFGRNISDEIVGLAAGFLIASMLVRVVAATAGVESWTATWRTINAATLWIIWPAELTGIGATPEIIGTLRPLDVVAATLAVTVGLYLLATRTFDRRR